MRANYTILGVTVIAAVTAIILVMGESVMDHIETMTEMEFQKEKYFREHGKVSLKK